VRIHGEIIPSKTVQKLLFESPKTQQGYYKKNKKPKVGWLVNWCLTTLSAQTSYIMP